MEEHCNVVAALTAAYSCMPTLDWKLGGHISPGRVGVVSQAVQGEVSPSPLHIAKRISE